jgi:hypothetical protein
MVTGHPALSFNSADRRVAGCGACNCRMFHVKRVHTEECVLTHGLVASGWSVVRGRPSEPVAGDTTVATARRSCVGYVARRSRATTRVRGRPRVPSWVLAQPSAGRTTMAPLVDRMNATLHHGQTASRSGGAWTMVQGPCKLGHSSSGVVAELIHDEAWSSRLHLVVVGGVGRRSGPMTGPPPCLPRSPVHLANDGSLAVGARLQRERRSNTGGPVSDGSTAGVFHVEHSLEVHSMTGESVRG